MPTVRCPNPNCRTPILADRLHAAPDEWRPGTHVGHAAVGEHDDSRSVSEADWLEFDSEANDYGVPDRAGLQSVIDAIGGHYLHLAREYGWLDTEVRDAVYVETKRRGWCGE